jgi:hypothetical protein
LIPAKIKTPFRAIGTAFFAGNRRRCGSPTHRLYHAGNIFKATCHGIQARPGFVPQWTGWSAKIPGRAENLAGWQRNIFPVATGSSVDAPFRSGDFLPFVLHILPRQKILMPDCQLFAGFPN